jgi:hypothetical protein
MMELFPNVILSNKKRFKKQAFSTLPVTLHAKLSGGRYSAAVNAPLSLVATSQQFSEKD